MAKKGPGNDISDLPVAGVCMEWMSEKAIAIWAVFCRLRCLYGLWYEFTCIGCAGHVEVVNKEMEELVGARWDFERDLKKIGRMVMDHIEKKRDALGINVSKERKLYDMAERRALEGSINLFQEDIINKKDLKG